ncbi:hypothetical protein CRENBAI_010162 [Crenichthys baileyi]|uniref:Uncharacterized protein n=1 Tax=Crenichthys baileyi TaxID=28760 RepID=A0AAV9RRW7_9TELE
MSGYVMELAEGETTQTLRPRSPAPLPSPPPEVATDLKQKGASQKRPSGQECGPTPNKGADQPAQRNQNTPHKGGPMTSTPSHPRTQGAQPTERPVPNAGHQTTATTRQAGQQNTSHSNTEASTKPRPIQNSSPTQKQAPGQDSQANRDHRANRAVKQTPRWTTPPTTMPKGKTPTQQAEGCHSARSKEATPPSRDADPPTSRGMAKTANPEHTEPTRKHPANGKPHPSTRPRSPTQAQSPATPALPHPRPDVRAATHRTTAPTPQHAIQRRTECSKEHPEQKLHTKLTLRKCTPHQPPKTKPPGKRTPTKRRSAASRSQNMPDTHTPARSSPARRPTPRPTKGKRARRAKTKTHPEAKTGRGMITEISAEAPVSDRRRLLEDDEEPR